MTPWMRILLPVGFGIVAALINFVVLNMLNQQTKFVRVKENKPLAQGTPFTPANIEALSVSGDVAKLNKAWIRFEDVHTIYGRPAGRYMEGGELILRQDAEPIKELKPGPDEDAMVLSLGTVEVEPKLLLIGEKIGFLIRSAREHPADETSLLQKSSVPKKPDPQDVDIKYLGPFRLLSVGDRLSRNVGENKKDNRGDGRTVTIAIPKITEEGSVDNKVDRLVRASTKSGNRGESDLLKLVLHRSQPKIDSEESEDGTTSSDSKPEGGSGDPVTDEGSASKPEEKNDEKTGEEKASDDSSSATETEM